ncbi:MAG: FMN-binding protein [Lachnospiraceae bacterium]|nr:FMN-binding protein [Lachnospiraceae bacterium]MBP3458935.1 FMN-binding protein [Lachnospiraceae bacterium]
MKKKKTILFLTAVLSLLLLSGCSIGNKMKDGYYTAEMSDFSHGWKEYVCILVKNDKIVSAEFNAKDESGFIKAWDNEYMRNMGAVNGTYPNKYTREYVQQLMEGQKGTKVDMVTGATSSGENFEKLISAVIKQAEKGNSAAAIVESEPEE